MGVASGNRLEATAVTFLNYTYFDRSGWRTRGVMSVVREWLPTADDTIWYEHERGKG